MKRNLLVTAFILTWVVSCVQEPRNVITGEIEGLEVGDKIILSVEAVEGATWIATDSAIVSKAGEFTLTTRATGCMGQLTRLKAGEAFNLHASHDPRCFLEGYAELRVTGNVEDWRDIKTSGGLYAHPDMQVFARLADSARVILEELHAIDNDQLLKEFGAVNDQTMAIDDAKLYTNFIKLREQRSGLSRREYLLQKEFREKHPGMAYSANILWHDYGLMRNPDKSEEAFLALAPVVQDSPAGRLVRDRIASVRASGIGAVAPDFTCRDMNGNEVTLSAFRGKHVLLDFWGSGCGPCRLFSNPALVKLHATLQAKSANIELIGIACGEQSDENWLEAVEKDNLTWTQLNDKHSGKSSSIQKQYAVDEIPVSLLISPEGKILHRGYPKDVIPEIEKLFEL